MNELPLTDFSSDDGANDATSESVQLAIPAPIPSPIASTFSQPLTTDHSVWAGPNRMLSDPSSTGPAALALDHSATSQPEDSRFASLPFPASSFASAPADGGPGSVPTSKPSAPGPKHGPAPRPEPVTEPAAARQRFGRRLAGVAALVAVAVGGGVVGSALTPTGHAALSLPAEQSTVTAQPIDLVNTSVTGATSGSTSHGEVANLITKTLPSVVDISVEMNGGSGTGSGFVISSDGRIVTNAHVVADATKIEVTFADKSKASATVLGVDRTDDLAVIQVSRTGLPALTLGSSAALRMGDPVVAIGRRAGPDRWTDGNRRHRVGARPDDRHGGRRTSRAPSADRRGDQSG